MNADQKKNAKIHGWAGTGRRKCQNRVIEKPTKPIAEMSPESRDITDIGKGKPFTAEDAKDAKERKRTKTKRSQFVHIFSTQKPSTIKDSASLIGPVWNPAYVYLKN